MAASVVAPTVLFAMANGLTSGEIEAATGLTPPDWMDRDRRLPNDAVPKLWRLLYAHTRDRALALEMAAAAPFDFFGSLAYGAQFASTLREALATFERYRGLLSDQLESRLVEAGSEAAFETRHALDALDAGAGAEVGVGIALRFVREVLGVPDALVAVRFGHDPLCGEARYAELLSLPFSFGHARTAVVFARDALDRGLPRRSTELFGFITRHLALAAERQAVPDGLAEVRGAIADQASRGEYRAEPLARALGVSLRVLQRRVAGHGTTVRALLDAAREENAKELLGDERLSVEEVGFLLGYSEERAFRRAFKRITGQSPAAWRRERS